MNHSISNLTARQEEFCQQYIRCNNAAEAARLAGYSKRSARQIGKQNLTKTYIRLRIRLLRDERLLRSRLNQDDIIRMLENAFTLNPFKVLAVSKDEVLLQSFHEIPTEYLSLITEIRLTSNGIRVWFFSKEKAIELRMKYHGLLDSNHPRMQIRLF